MKKIITDIKVADLIPLIDKKWLVGGLWKLKGKTGKGEKVLGGFTDNIDGFGFEPKLVFDLFKTRYGDGYFTLYRDDEVDVAAFHIDRLLLDRQSGSMPINDTVAIMCVTIGERVRRASEELHDKGEYANFFYLYGFAAALAEALTEYGHRLVCSEIGCRREESFRVSPGYTAWPGLSDQKLVDKLIRIDRIGVRVSETNQLIPEFSTTSMIFFRMGDVSGPVA